MNNEHIDSICHMIKEQSEKDVKELKEDIKMLEERVNRDEQRLNTHGIKLDEHIELAKEFKISIDNLDDSINTMKFDIKSGVNSIKYTIFGALGLFILEQFGLVEFIKALM